MAESGDVVGVAVGPSVPPVVWCILLCRGCVFTYPPLPNFQKNKFHPRTDREGPERE